MIPQLASAALAFSLILSPLAAQAATEIAVLNVHNARCELCPLIIEGALKQVKGVETVRVGAPNKAGDMTAEVVFDGTATTAVALGKVVTEQGYPTQVAKEVSAQDILMMKPMK